MTFDSNRQARGPWLAFAFVCAVGCARAASTTPLSAEPATETVEGPSSDRRAQPDGAPAASATPAPAESSKAAASATPASSAAPASEAQTAASAASKKSDEVASARGTARIELLDAGKEPRQKLRFGFHVGETLKIRVKNEMSMELQLKTKTVRQPIPVIEIMGTIETLSVDAQGSARRRSSYSSLRFLNTPGVDPELKKRMEKQLEGFAGVTLRELVSSRGESLERELDLSSIKNPELKSTLEGMADSMAQGGTPFPEEAVGVGARWRIQRVTKQRELSIDHDTTMRLTALKGNRLEAEISGKSSARAPAGAAKNEPTIESLETTTTGQQRMTLDPISLDSDSASETTTVTRVKDTRINMHMSMKFSVSIAK